MIGRGEAQAIADDIMKSNPDLKIRVVCMHNHEDDIRFELDTSVGTVMFLNPRKADWHTYYLFIKEMERQRNVGIQLGLMLAAERLAAHNEDIITGRLK